MIRVVCWVRGHDRLTVITGVNWEPITLLTDIRGRITAQHVECRRCGRRL